MNKLVRNKYEIIIFLVDAISMILELIASRVLSPYFGNSNIVWTSVIGIILLSCSIGNYIGGKIADRDNKEKTLKLLIMLSAIFIMINPLIQEIILPLISTKIQNIKIGAIIATTILFLIPSILMGTVMPIILKIKINNLETTGKESGKITAIGTIGGIFGTFIGGFLLIPNIGSVYILYILAIVLAIVSQLIEFKIKEKNTLIVLAVIIISFILMFVSINTNNESGKNVLEKEIGQTVSFDTQYGRVLIYNGSVKNEPVRVLNIDSGYESATFTNDDKTNELVFEYTKFYNLMFESNTEINDTLLIGGAGYSYPKYYISHYPKKRMDVVEIDGDITEIAKKYFYLDKLIKDYNLEEKNRLNLITEDGRVYLNNNKKKYDAILNDAFSGENPAKTLTTKEAISQVKKSLNENGLYLTNIISSLEGENSKFIKAEVNTLKKYFKNVYVIPCKDIKDLHVIQNNMVICTDQEIEYENTYNLNIGKDELIITDEYCPIDSLVPQR